MPVCIDQWREEIGCFINFSASNFFYAHMMPEFLLKISYLKFFAISTLLYTSSKMFPYMDNFFAKLRLGTSSRVSRVYFNLLYSMVEIFNFGK